MAVYIGLVVKDENEVKPPENKTEEKPVKRSPGRPSKREE